jgi:cell wall-associated NlpC family hydrolase
MTTEVTVTASPQRFARWKQVVVNGRSIQLLAIAGLVPLALTATTLSAHAATSRSATYKQNPATLHLMWATPTAMKVSWQAAPGAISYTYRLFQMNGVQVRSDREPGTIRTVISAGLHPGWRYQAQIAATPGQGATLYVTLPSRSPAREVAYQWAETQAGTQYRYGGQGHGGYDCSGLVRAAYRHAGIWLPRTTTEMLQYWKLDRESSPHQGDLVFFGTGHVELYAGPDQSFGAETNETGTWWNRWWPGTWWPTAFYRVSDAD